jgi:hypothetical protein
MLHSIRAQLTSATPSSANATRAMYEKVGSLLLAKM